jgi:hypothetical protein
MRKKRKRTIAGVSLLLAASFSAWAGGQKPAAQAVIAGSVHRDTGFALPGAEIVVAPWPESGGGAKPKGRWRTSTNSRGEFAVRVPAGRMRYNVTVRASGYRTEEKPVTIGADERVDLSFILEPAAK